MSFGYQICEGLRDLGWRFSHPLLGLTLVQICGTAFQICGVVLVPKNVGILDSHFAEFNT